MNVLSPEEIELNKKRKVLERLKDTLATREEAMADLRAALEQFEANYTMEVGRFYADLDEIEAQIAEEEVKLNPDDEEIKQRAEEARIRAEESAANAEEENWEGCSFKWQPTTEAKKAYHNLARIIHPDLALDTEEKEKRHNLMAQLNDAYSAGDQNLLNKLVEDFRDSPDLVKGDSVGDELIRAIRQISQVKNRLIELRGERLKIGIERAFYSQTKSAFRDARRQKSSKANRRTDENAHQKSRTPSEQSPQRQRSRRKRNSRTLRFRCFGVSLKAGNNFQFYIF